MRAPSPLSSIKLKQFRKLKQKKYRSQNDSYLCEGFRLFDAAMNLPDLEIRELIISEDIKNSKRGVVAINKAGQRGVSVFITNKSVMKSISEDVTPPGIIFSVDKMVKTQIPVNNLKDSSILYLEKISEPGNLGSIIRSACWFGIKSILLSPESVDPWNPKSVRASAGAIFKTKIYTDIKYSLFKEEFRKKNYNFIATVASGGKPITKWLIGTKNILFLGSEATGLSKDITKDADELISIPGFGNVESLNLSSAASIIMYEITRVQRMSETR